MGTQEKTGAEFSGRGCGRETDSIASEDRAALSKLLNPMIDVAYAMPVGELVAAMRALYAATETNCPWYAYGLRHTLPPILAVIGQGKDGYEEAWLTPLPPHPANQVK